ncbi:COG4315 family predicted lipoprotein [Pseudarthrobacter oxydans]|jgi:predicted lipoprotein with Yx(FWY)xxD motif|uniref:COG4315 family predicted lipoprotein n=1 Tax=Pseudarthrobacter oxydans TaxID=1671 RepID=UPI00382292AB
MKLNVGAGLAILALSAALTACGGSTGTAPETTSPAVTEGSPPASATAPAASVTPPSATQESAAVDLMTATSSAGEIVVDANGMSVYFFTKDVKDSGTSACTDACLAAWPPVTTAAETPQVEGVTGTVGTITTPDGAKQVTLNGLPLYYFAKDTKAGDILGQGVNGVWYLADPSGEMIRMGASGY